ncbi:MAG TPA: choice-of-anchor D domain-containing protein, partial [Pirellulales bacterium]|nr:choice-of-anchor D domain-containing protein [Pirellulales bacterium]
MKSRDYWNRIRSRAARDRRPRSIRARQPVPSSRNALLERLETRQLLTASIQISDGGTQLYNSAYDSFGQVTIGEEATKTFNVANSGDEQLEVDQPSTPYGFSAQGAFPLYVNPGDSADFTVSMDTTNVNQYSGQLWIDNSDPNNEPFLINLDGTVVAPPPALSVLDGMTTLDNDPYGYGTNPDDFGSTPAGTPVDKVLTITNSSASDLSVSNLWLPEGFSLVGTFPTTVPANGSTTFTVELDASSVSTASGELSFSDTDPGGGGFYQFAVSGTVVAPPPALTVLDGMTTLDNDPYGYGTTPDDFGSTPAGTPVD